MKAFPYKTKGTVIFGMDAVATDREPFRSVTGASNTVSPSSTPKG